MMFVRRRDPVSDLFVSEKYAVERGAGSPRHRHASGFAFELVEQGLKAACHVREAAD